MRMRRYSSKYSNSPLQPPIQAVNPGTRQLGQDATAQLRLQFGTKRPARAAEPPGTWPRPNGMSRCWPGIMAFSAVVTMSAGVTGCAPGKPQVTTAALPTVVCGTVLSTSAAGPVVYDATRPLPTINHPTVGGVLMFRVARGCEEGTHVAWVPSSAAHLVKAAYAKDGQTAAVVLKPSGPHAAFRLTGTRNGRVVASTTVRLAS
jgi:hypothetical protein